MKGNIIKLLEEIIRVNLFDFGMDNGSQMPGAGILHIE